MRIPSILVAIVLPLLAIPQHSFAANASEWQAGNIISDNAFTYATDMSVADIQNFLNGLNPNCDTTGTQPATDWGRPDMTHAQYAASQGWPGPPYVCLRNYYEVPKTAPSAGMPDNSYNHGGGAFAGGVSAAQLIYNAAQQYSINPKVLLVTIQKESSGPLTTDTWPLQKQYTYAMGAHCPDSGPGGTANCDPNYAGFSIQISESAALLRYYLDNMNQPWWQYKKPFQSNYILWNVSQTNCGGSNVTIQSKATAALYTYTPYQPNAAALANLYGTGDACSAYGNRNFWRIYTDWFGRPTSIPISGCTEATNTTISCVWKAVINQNDTENLTTSYAEINDLVNRLGDSYGGVAFFAHNAIAPAAGNVPVYGLGAEKGQTFLTASPTEYQALKNAGWVDQGIVFYADPAGVNSGYPVYRLYNSTNGYHVWTGSNDEVARYKSLGYSSEGIAFDSLSTVNQPTAPPAGKMLTYRFYMPQTFSHFWTTSLWERDQMIRAGYNYEGVAWLSSANTTDLPVYRLYAPALRMHLYTIDSNERDTLVASGGWQDEGVNQYVSKAPTSNPVYRLYAPSLGAHQLTTDAYERSVLLASGHWKDEGIAWYQP